MNNQWRETISLTFWIELNWGEAVKIRFMKLTTQEGQTGYKNDTSLCKIEI